MKETKITRYKCKSGKIISVTTTDKPFESSRGFLYNYRPK